MKRNNALAYLRQLCCSGLSKEIVIPEFLYAVQTLLPSQNNTFTGVDEQFNPVYQISEFGIVDLVENVPVSKADFVLPESKSRTSEWFIQRPISDQNTESDQLFHSYDLCNLVMRNNDHHCLYAPVLKEYKLVGILNLCRPRQQKSFDNQEQALFSRVLPYVAQALKATGQQDIRYCQNGSSGMMILDTQGKILFLSDEAKLLLALACHSILSVDASVFEVDMTAKLVQLCRNLEADFRGKRVTPPSWCHNGPNGRFLFNTYWLKGENHKSGNLVGITIEHQEPLMLKILRAMRNLPLSPTQKEVAMLITQGVSSEKIGEHLHIKPSTVKDHIGKIFTKLDIHHREELLPKLQALYSSMNYAKERLSKGAD
jgi:DNA-binding CsgD family transcriptional regulator